MLWMIGVGSVHRCQRKFERLSSLAHEAVSADGLIELSSRHV